MNNKVKKKCKKYKHTIGVQFKNGFKAQYSYGFYLEYKSGLSIKGD